MSARRGRVLVVGVGGLGTPCARSLADLGVASLVLVDPDVVDLSNLPRQGLYEEGDVGRPKAEVAAARLARPGLEVRAVVARFAPEHAPALLAGVDVVVDGTDGAATKDLVHAVAVRARVPVVHAAALGSEARLLDVAAGGRPCLCCLFGRTGATATADTCASFGVFPGVVRAAGECAAAAAWRLLGDPRAPTKGLRVLDLEAGRAITLAVTADPQCPLCGEPAPRAHDTMGADPAGAGASASAFPAVAPDGVLDLRDTSCPLNLLRAKRAVAAVAPGETVAMWLGREGAATVPEGLASLGHTIRSRAPMGDGLALVVERAADRALDGDDARPAGDARWLARFARQIVLPGVGEAGQRRLGSATLAVDGEGDAADACVEVLERAGAGAVLRRTRSQGGAGVAVDPGVARVRRIALAAGGRGPVARARGALLADAAMRVVFGLPAPCGPVSPDGTAALAIDVRDDGTVGEVRVSR